MDADAILKDTVVLIPALNEEETLPGLLGEIHELYPELPVVVINDGSADDTAGAARRAGAVVLDLPYNIGVAGAVQAGLKYARDHGYAYAVRMDGDGQHDPASIPALAEAMAQGKADLVIGSRYVEGHAYKNTVMRTVGIGFLSVFLSYICRSRVTDPTSGFHMFSKPLVYYFSKRYPADYPEPESLALLRRQGYAFAEVPASFRPRKHGVSSLNGWSSVYFAMKVTFALIVDRARTVDRVYARDNLVERLKQS